MLETGMTAYFNGRDEVRITEIQNTVDGTFIRAVGTGLENEDVQYAFAPWHFKLTPHVEREVAQ